MRNNDLLVMILTTIAILVVSYIKYIDPSNMNTNQNKPTIHQQRLAKGLLNKRVV